MEKNTFTKEEAKAIIAGLVEKFEAQKEYYKSTNYNETQTRQDFINPFFDALNWDMSNEKRLNETQREVRHEDKIKIKGRTKAPDYSFNIKGKRKFFVEAKKPSVDIKENIEPALQVRNYGWNAKLNISLLTDFEEFAIYDCTKKIRKNDTAYSKRIKYISYTQYLKDFDFIWDTFEYQNVLNNSIESFAKKIIDFKTAEPVDVEFLASLNTWRNYLATTIALRNKHLEENEINFAVQLIIDRIVFLRVCEDRKIEQEGQLEEIAKSKGNVYQNLFAYFERADQKYNSGLFDLNKDSVTRNLEIDNKVIKNIISELFETGYNFAIIPVEILGFAYEQFLGKVIRLTAGHRAVIEEKPEVRKAGGVYYTPDYIVNYIVENTVGKLVEGKTPEQVSEIKILDPSCGSGSFLIGAYQFLLNWHLDFYKMYPTKGVLTAENELTSKEKKRILLNNIFGVDIDTQAVEVTKLSLLLKALEGETEDSIRTSLQIFNERVLPTIDSNIQCGNSLIAPDFYNQELFLTPQEERKINVFDWKNAFPAVFKKGGFDAIIGNPPYFSLDTISNVQKDYLEKKFSQFATRQSNIYFFFIATAHMLLKDKGVLSFINERYYFNSKNAQKFRKFVQTNFQIKEIVDFKNIQIFEGVNTLTVINTFQKGDITNDISIIQFNNELRTLKEHQIKNEEFAQFFKMNQANLDFSDWNFSNPFLQSLKDKYRKYPTLDKVVDMGQGIKSGLNEVFIVDEKTIIEYNIENCILRKYVKTRDIQQYNISFRKLYLILTLNTTIKKDIPNTVKYLKQYQNKLKDRYQFKDGVCNWYSLSIPQNLHLFQNSTERILTPLYSKGNKFAYDNCDDEHNFYALTDTFILAKKNEIEISLKYLLGVLNSSLLNFFNRHFGKLKRDGYYEYSRNTLSKLPICIPKTKVEKAAHDKLVSLVDTMLDLQSRLQSSRLQSDKDTLLRRISYTDTQINELVYQLYEITQASDRELIESSH